MADVSYEGARIGFDDAYEVWGDGVGDTVGVATFAVDRRYDGTPTGAVDPLPIRVYVMDADGTMTGEEGAAMMAYLDLDAAEELRDALDAAIDQVRLTRHDAARHPNAGRRRLAGPSAGQNQDNKETR
jgi:hypothetical protein